MSEPEETPKLRMAPNETPEQYTERYRKKVRADVLRHEAMLEGSVQPFRVGSVPYLNAVPLTRGLEEDIIFVPPSRLAEMLQKDELDAALVSITEVLFNDRYDILDGIAVASLGEVKSVFLAHNRPLQEVQEVYCDTASLTSVQLLRVLLAERGLRPVFKPLAGYAAESMPDYALLIGNPALDFLRTPHPHDVWDLGTAWFELTGLPFVYAVWALRRGVDYKNLCHRLREARDFGLETLDHIINSRPEYDREFRKDYLGWHIHYHLCEDEQAGIARFIELLRRHQDAPVYDPGYVR